MNVDPLPAIPDAGPSPSDKGYFRWMIVVIVVLGVLIAWAIAATGDGDVTYDGFLQEVIGGASCEDLFEYRNDLRLDDPSTTDELNDELRFIGCRSATSKRGDQRPSTPSTVCEGAYSDHRSVRLDYSSQWSTVAIDGDRRLLVRLSSDFLRVWICDINIRGEYDSPDSMSVRSVFVMAPVGVAPDEVFPSDVAMWAEADSR